MRWVSGLIYLLISWSILSLTYSHCPSWWVNSSTTSAVLFCTFKNTACSFDLSATSQQYFSLRTNQPPAISQQYFSLRTNQHQPSAAGCRDPNGIITSLASRSHQRTRSGGRSSSPRHISSCCILCSATAASSPRPRQPEVASPRHLWQEQDPPPPRSLRLLRIRVTHSSHRRQEPVVLSSVDPGPGGRASALRAPPLRRPGQ
jgi:hypothetical protein